MTMPTPAAQVRNGNTCGTACHVAKTDDHSYWLTNAHVAGTQIGKEMNLHTHDGKPATMRAAVVAAAFRRGSSVDIAVLRSAPHHSTPIPIAIDGPVDDDPQHSGGAPRCEPCSWKHRYVRQQTDALTWSSPVAIGGESGSGVQDAQERAIVGLIAWSSRGMALAMNSRVVHQALTTEAIPAASLLPADAKVACENPQPTEDGISFEAAPLPTSMWTNLKPTDPDPGEPDCPTIPPTPKDLQDWIQWIRLILEILEQLPLDQRQKIARSIPTLPQISDRRSH